MVYKGSFVVSRTCISEYLFLKNFVMKNEERLENIDCMEKIFNELESSLKDMEKSFNNRKRLYQKFKKLMEYYDGEQWKKDYDDVNIWKLKPKWPHWILSEDAIYDFYENQKELCEEMIKFINKVFKF